MPKICLMCGDSFPDATTFCPKDGSALRAAVHGDDLIGELIADRYLITDLLSQGGMGAVYVASDVRLPQKFAVKVLKQNQSPDPTLIARFRQEAEAVCRINHDRVARVFDFGFMPDGRAYIIMEYVAGRTLKQLIDDRGALEPIEAARIIGMTAEGMDAAHRLGIVHRDLKPENVMILDDAGGGTRVKVLDFGIAKLQNADADQGHTQAGYVIGTPAWMSPEQLMGETIDPRSDIYSLGLLAFALLTGLRPFTGDSEQAEMLARITTVPRTLAEALPTTAWPADVQALFDSTLARESAQRPATAVLFAKTLLDLVTAWNDRTRAGSTAPTRANGAAASAAASAPSRASASNASPANASSNAAGASRRTLAMSVGGVVVVGAIVLGVMLTRKDAGSPEASVAPQASTGATDVAAPAPTPSDGVLRDTSAVPVAPATTPAASPAPSTATASSTKGPAVVADARKPVATPNTPAVRVPDAAVESPKPTAPATTQRSADLQRIMDHFDRDDSQGNAKLTIIEIDAIRSKLGPVDQGWAWIYTGLSQFAMNDKTQACVSFERASKVPGVSEAVRKDSEDKRLMIGCRPSI